MLKKLNANFVLALVTSWAIIAFAFYQRYETSVTVPAVAFFVGAAVMCLLPLLYAALFRRTACRNNTPR